jgi:hypothetical protein
MPTPLTPDAVIPPPRPRGPLSDETLDLFSSLMDSAFSIPGTRIRFGLDAIVGLVPGLGDVLTGLAAFLIVFVAWQRQLPRVTQARMVANIAIDTIIGAIPIMGDLFDVAWKSNRKNFHLLQRAASVTRGRQQLSDWLFLMVLFLVAGTIIAVPFAVLVWIVHRLR